MLSTIYIAVPFIVFIINFFLAALVIRGEWRSFRHRIFAAFLTGMSLWGFTIFGMRSSPDTDIAFLWERFTVFPSIVFSSVLFYHFTLVFTDTRRSRSTLRVLYGFATLVTILSFAGLVATGMHERFFYGFAPELGPAFTLYLATAYIPMILAYRVLFQRLRSLQNSEERIRVIYVITGISMSVFGGTTDFLPPLGFQIYPLGVVMNIGFGFTTTIAVTRYRLFELRTLLRRGFFYSIISTGIFAVYGAILFAFTIIFSSRTASANILATIAALIIATLALPPVIAKAQRFVDRLFYRERYDHLIAMQEFTANTRDIGDFSGLADSLVHTVRQALQADWATALIPDAEDERFVPASTPDGGPADDLQIAKNSWVASWLAQHNEVLTPRLIEYDPYLQAMAASERELLLSSGVQLLVPLKTQGELTGVLALGPRVVEEAYSASDIRTLTTVASQTAAMIENSRMYSQEMDRLRELERLNSLKSNLLRTVSHELKSPITAVKTAVDLLAIPEGELNERAKTRLMRTLQNGIDRLERLVGESLEYAQMRSSEMEVRREPTMLGDLVEQVVALMGPNISAKRQNLMLDIEPDLPELLVDPDQVERVILNLVNNANKFTPANGDIAIRIRNTGSAIVLTVEDNGRGIPDGDQANIFGEYYRGSNADGLEGAGTGLGLAIAKSLVELHGGQISFVSKQDEGTTFSLSLPLLTNLREEDGEGEAAPVAQA
jgi:K+-sensing histidine kinase KdpD